MRLASIALVALVALPLVAQAQQTAHSPGTLSTRGVQAYDVTNAQVGHDSCRNANGVWVACIAFQSPGWVRYTFQLSGPDGKGYDRVQAGANAHAFSDCAITLARGAPAGPMSSPLARTTHYCSNGIENWDHTNLNVYLDDPGHQGGLHSVFVECTETPWCDLTVGHEIRVYASYQDLAVDMRDVTQEAFGPSNLAPETCVTLWIDGSPHHRNVEVSLDWGLGAAAVQTTVVDLGADSVWSERRCQVLPLSVLDYNVCFQAREIDGLRRQLVECRTVSGGIL